MQNNPNLSSNDKKTVSLDNIIDGIDTSALAAENKEKFDEAMKKLDAMFEADAADLAWLDDIMSDGARKKPESMTEETVSVPEEQIYEEPEQTEDVIIAENPDIDDALQYVDTVEETADREPVFTDEASDDIDDDDTKIYVPGSSAAADNSASGAPEEVEFDDFEGADEGEYVHDVDSAAKQQEARNVNNSLGRLFGLSDDIEEEQNTKSGKKDKSEHRKIAKELGAYEEINMADPDAVGEGQRRFYLKKCRALISLFGAAFFFLAGLYLELAAVGTLPAPGFLRLENNPALFALIDLQVMCFSAMCVLDSLVYGFYSMLDKKFSPASCALAIFSICTLHAVVSTVLGGKVNINMFCAVGCLALFMLALYDYLRASADDKAYRIASSTSNKYGAYEIGVNSLECSPFASHIDREKAKVISVCKGSVYEGFVGRNEKRPEDEKKLGKMTTIIAIVAVLIAVFVAVFFAGATISEKFYMGVTTLTLILTSSIPLNLFLVSALPKYLAAKNGKNINATLVGQNASEEYNGLSVVAFEDTEVFLPKDVRISSIKTYGGMALDEAVVIMSKIYGKIGGPLSKIFAKMVVVKNPYSDVRLVKVYPDAIEVNVDGRDVCLATASYLGANGIRIINDTVDNSFEQSHGSILFMVCGGRILAKFYIKYTMNPAFEKTLKELHDANLCVGIKTLDPCITNDLVFSCLEKANYALSVIKGSSANDIPTVRNKVSSGVVALGSVHNFLEMLLICERTGRNVKINNVIKLISALLCVILSSLFMITNHGSLNITFCLIIQAFWLIPVAAVSYFNK